MVSNTNNQIVEIWNKYRNLKHKCLKRAPLFFHDFKKNRLLFIGLNPSFSPRGSKKTYAGTKYEDWNLEKFLKWKNLTGNELNDYIEECVKIEEISIKKYPYFRKFQEIAEELSRQFEHIDLFFFREKSQKESKKLVYPENRLTDFGRDQFEIALNMIDIIEPDLILVANALASNIMLEQLENKLNLEDNLGTYTLLVKDKKVPIFFSGMLTGQRALDRESFIRLKWHMRYVLNQTSVRS